MAWTVNAVFLGRERGMPASVNARDRSPYRSSGRARNAQAHLLPHGFVFGSLLGLLVLLAASSCVITPRRSATRAKDVRTRNPVATRSKNAFVRRHAKNAQGIFVDELKREPKRRGLWIS
jgi:hypothetical protein